MTPAKKPIMSAEKPPFPAPYTPPPHSASFDPTYRGDHRTKVCRTLKTVKGQLGGSK